MAILGPASETAATVHEFVVNMTADQLVPSNPLTNDAASGVFSVDDETNVLSWNFVLTGIATPTTSMHLHVGAVGVAGPILVDLGTATTGGPDTLINSIVTSAANVDSILANPQGHYIDIHWVAPLVRGQLASPAEPCLSTDRFDEAGVLAVEPATWSVPPASPCACGPSDASVPGPPLNGVLLATGEFTTQAVDLRIRGRGVDMAWVRTYRSRNGRMTAQGHGWDFSYNVSVLPCGADRTVGDGTGRIDRYEPDPLAPRWQRREHFRSLFESSSIPNGPLDQYTLLFADTGRWNFHPFTAGHKSGKLREVVDRNGNMLKLAHDVAGRLTKVEDALSTVANPRFFTISYDAAGRIVSVADYTGRTVTYTYTGDDLTKVTGPVVSGTPNDNDFPLGKSWLYTYSSGHADDRLNHNLQTITDPKGQTYVQNTYSSSTDPTSLDFDRVVEQRWGGPDERLFVAYESLATEPLEGQPFLLAVVNDRNRNVSEWTFDGRNRLITLRRYSGRAPDAAQTTSTTNRPKGKLRPEDPDSFLQTWQHNDDALPTAVVMPNEATVINTYEEDPAAPRRSRGNLRKRERLAGPRGGDQQSLVDLYEYDSDFGCGGCGSNFVTKHIDPRDNATTHSYDANGNRLHTQHRLPAIVEDFAYNQFGQLISHTLPPNDSGHRRVDTIAYYDAASPAHGYVQSRTIDAGGYALTTAFEYDARGNPTKVIDPRGNPSTTTYNQLDQVMVKFSRPVATPSGVVEFALATHWYDANGNVVRSDIANHNDQGVLVEANRAISTIMEYEILDRPSITATEKGVATLGNSVTAIAQIADLSQFIVTESRYDANRNPVLSRSGEAMKADGGQPRNMTYTQYDERDLVFRTTRAPVVDLPPAPAIPDPPNPLYGDGLQSTTQRDYDVNGNLARELVGIEAPYVTEPARFGDGTVREWTWSFDGFDRLQFATDPMGNLTSHHYDANSNRVSTRVDGQLFDVEGSTGNVRLSERSALHDPMDRVVQTQMAFFHAETGLDIDDGASMTSIQFAPNSQVVSTTDDLGNTSQTLYDTANRTSSTIDALGNSVTFTYDANSNVISTIEFELPDGDGPPEVYTTTHEFDALDRLVKTIDNIGNSVAYGYDSRNNRTLITDPLGQRTRQTWDAADRPVKTIIDMDGNLSMAPPDDPAAEADNEDIVLGQEHDDNFRCVARSDDGEMADSAFTPAPNTTQESFDERNNLVETDYADCPDQPRVFDVHGNLLSECLPNGARVTCEYDLLNRLVRKTVDVAASCNFETGFNVAPQADTTWEEFDYDGLSRLRRAANDDTEVHRTYDSLGHVLQEIQVLDGDPAITASAYDGVGNRQSCDYPGGRIVEWTYDALNRVKTISDDLGLVAKYFYIGPHRVAARVNGNGTRCDYTYDGIAPNPPGDSGVRQVVRTKHTRIVTPPKRDGEDEVIDDRTYTWDGAGNKLSRADLREGGPQLIHSYAYDAAYRLRETIVTSAAVGDDSAGCIRETFYVLDGVGNRIAVAGCGTPNVGDYDLDPTCGNEPADREMNQYTRTSFDGRCYDDNGNLIAIAVPGAELARSLDARRSAYEAVGSLAEATRLARAHRDGMGSEKAREARDGDRARSPEIDRAEATSDGHAAAGRASDRALASGATSSMCDSVLKGYVPKVTLQYDYANRLVGWTGDRGDGVATHRYRYDALGRRVAKDVYIGDPRRAATTRFLLDGWQEIEECDGSGATVATYIFGLYIDEAITMTRSDAPVSGETFFHADELHTVMAVSLGRDAPPDVRGDVMEWYEYDDYGAPVSRTSLPAVPADMRSPTTQNPIGFTGRRFDDETGWWYFRTRQLDSQAGRFVTRDSSGVWHDAGNLGNGAAYCGSRPAHAVDPLGKNWFMEQLPWQWQLVYLPLAESLFVDAPHAAVVGAAKGAKEMVGLPADAYKAYYGSITGQQLYEGHASKTAEAILDRGHSSLAIGGRQLASIWTLGTTERVANTAVYLSGGMSDEEYREAILGDALLSLPAFVAAKGSAPVAAKGSAPGAGGASAPARPPLSPKGAAAYEALLRSGSTPEWAHAMAQRLQVLDARGASVLDRQHLIGPKDGAAEWARPLGEQGGWMWLRLERAGRDAKGRWMERLFDEHQRGMISEDSLFGTLDRAMPNSLFQALGGLKNKGATGVFNIAPNAPTGSGQPSTGSYRSAGDK